MSQAYIIVNLTFDLTMTFRGHNWTVAGHTLYFGTYKSAIFTCTCISSSVKFKSLWLLMTSGDLGKNVTAQNIDRKQDFTPLHIPKKIAKTSYTGWWFISKTVQFQEKTNISRPSSKLKKDGHHSQDIPKQHTIYENDAMSSFWDMTSDARTQPILRFHFVNKQ